MLSPLIGGGGIKRWCCLMSVCLTSDVCLSRILGLSCDLHIVLVHPSARKTKIGIEVSNITRDSDTTFNVKRSKVKVTWPLYSPRRLPIRQLQRWAWESIHCGNLLLRCRRQREALRRPQREERGGAYRGGRPPTACRSVPVHNWSSLCTVKADYVTRNFKTLKTKLSYSNRSTQ